MTVRRHNIFRKYRLLPLIVIGFISVCLITLIGLLIWGLVDYQAQLDVAQQSVIPSLIYLGSVFFAAVLMTALIRGGTVFPSAVVSLLAVIFSFIFADSEIITIGGVLLKILITLLDGILGFTLTKLYFIFSRPPGHREFQNKTSQSLAEPLPMMADDGQ